MKEKAERGHELAVRLTYSGVVGAAARAGCSREHLSKVLHGRRRAGAELRARLMRMGITMDSRGAAL